MKNVSSEVSKLKKAMEHKVDDVEIAAHNNQIEVGEAVVSEIMKTSSDMRKELQALQAKIDNASKNCDVELSEETARIHDAEKGLNKLLSETLHKKLEDLEKARRAEEE